MSKSVLGITSTRFLAGFFQRCFGGRNDVDVHTAQSVETGLKLAAQLHPDFAILDATTAGPRLPHLCTALAKRVSSPLIVVYAPGSAVVDLLPEAQLSCQGRVVLLEKPFTAKALVEAVLGPAAISESERPDKISWLKTEPGVLGYVSMHRDGTVSCGGGGNPTLAAAMNSVVDLAAHLGQKLGMERLIGIKFFGQSTRCLVEKRAEETLTVVTSPGTDVAAISRNLRQSE